MMFSCNLHSKKEVLKIGWFTNTALNLHCNFAFIYGIAQEKIKAEMSDGEESSDEEEEDYSEGEQEVQTINRKNTAKDTKSE